jgi:hypothetical protein
LSTSVPASSLCRPSSPNAYSTISPSAALARPRPFSFSSTQYPTFAHWSGPRAMWLSEIVPAGSRPSRIRKLRCSGFAIHARCPSTE